MKTITQLQAELRVAAEHIETLSQELAQLQPAESKQGLDFANIRALAKRAPIGKHRLCGESADLQQEYLTLLTAPLLLDCQEPENGWLFLQRTIYKAGSDCSTDDLRANAATLNDGQLDRFSDAVCKAGLADALMLDGMLLCLTCGGGAAMRAWLAQLAAYLGRTLQQVDELGQLAALLVQSDKKALPSFLRRNLHIDLCAVGPRIAPLSGWFTHRTAEGCLIHGDGVTPLDAKEVFSTLNLSNCPTLEIRNAVFAKSPFVLAAASYPVWFYHCVFRDITSTDGSCVRCHSRYLIEFHHCRFERLEARDYTVSIQGPSEGFILDDVQFRNIRSTVYNGYTLNFSKCDMHAVTMEEIHGKLAWYYGSGGSADGDCFYARCSGRAVGLPSGIQEKG